MNTKLSYMKGKGIKIIKDKLSKTEVKPRENKLLSFGLLKNKLMKQTYEEAVLKTVMWWAEKIQQPLNQNNGDDSKNGGMMFMLMNTVSNNAQQSITPDKIKIFQESLTEKLIAVKNDKYRRTDLDVDYHPNRMLSECAEKANIDLSVFPCKTWTRIDLENQVEVSMGYGTVPSVI